jgi:hypothetical protein
MANVDRYISAQDIINRAAVETGLNPTSDVFGSPDPAFTQLRYLLNTCGQDLCEMYRWEILVREHSITTSDLDSGQYPLPDDFGRMIDQTGWDRTNNVPLGGPMSPQTWQYLLGRDLVTSTIYASFRIVENEFWIFPNDPVPDGIDVHFEYVSRNWVQSVASPGVYQDKITQNSDIVLFKPTMIVKYLKVKWLEAKGFNSTKAEQDFTTAFQAASGGDKGAPVLWAGGPRFGFRYLDLRNAPDSWYGLDGDT